MEDQLKLAAEHRKSKKPRLKNVGGGRLIEQTDEPTNDPMIEMTRKLAYAQAYADEDLVQSEIAKQDILIRAKR